MWYYLLKIFISLVILISVSEIAKRSSFWAAALASLPIVSLLAIVWLYIDTKDVDRIATLSKDILWLVIPSLLFFILLPQLLQKGVAFWPSLGISCAATIAGYVIMLKLIG